MGEENPACDVINFSNLPLPDIHSRHRIHINIRPHHKFLFYWSRDDK